MKPKRKRTTAHIFFCLIIESKSKGCSGVISIKIFFCIHQHEIRRKGFDFFSVCVGEWKSSKLIEFSASGSFLFSLHFHLGLQSTPCGATWVILFFLLLLLLLFIVAVVVALCVFVKCSNDVCNPKLAYLCVLFIIHFR